MSLGRTNNVLILINKSKLFHRPVTPVSALCLQQQRNLTSDPHKLEDIKAIRGKPWPFHRFPGICQFIDKTKKRLNENSKIVVVQGPMRIGKHEVAKELAKRFDMKYYPDVTCDDIFKLPSGFDLRELNDQLPDWLQFTDFESFYKEPDPSKMVAIGRTQIKLYTARFAQYADALTHILNTGQGCVMVGGAFQEICYARLLWRRGYFTREGYKYYRNLRENSLVELWKPHVIVHYDAPVSLIREKINERNAPGEVNSPVLTDEYIEALRGNIKKNLYDYRKTVEQLKFDVRGLDMDIVVEKLEKVNVTPDILSDEMLEDWNVQFSEDYSMYRMKVSHKRFLAKLLGVPGPLTTTSKVTITDDDVKLYKRVVLQHPEVKYAIDVPRPDNMSHQWRT